VVAKLMAVCAVLLLLGGAVQAADYHATPATAAAIELDDRPVDIVVPIEPVLALPIRHGISIEMPRITQLITYVFASRMDRPPRN
jgi:hypothetical protein